MKYFMRLALSVIIALILTAAAFNAPESFAAEGKKASADIQSTLNEIQKTQKEILQKLDALEKKVSGPAQPPRPAVDYSKVYTIPIGNSPVKGDKHAPVIIAEFSDFQCPYCAQLQSTIKEVLKAYPKEVKLVFKQYPLSFHPQARNASKASLAAEEQGKFWEMHDLIFENFSKLSEDKFKEFAGKIGLNMEKFIADYASSKYDIQIQQDITLGNNVGVTGTPTLFINGKRMQGRSVDDFKATIDGELKRK
ncbi:MAG: thioredoxin domain-containing protein [Nitrospirae bacterium]|nr:thioredoxin domain-containing protein [Nitrospirota bacterium]